MTFHVEIDAVVNGQKRNGNFVRQVETLEDVRSFANEVGVSGADVRIWDISKKMTATPHKTITIQ